MSIYEEKLIHDRRLFAKLSCSYEMGKRVLGNMKERGEISPETTPSGRDYLSPAEAMLFSRDIQRK